MTRFAVTWSAFGGHRIYNTRAEAQAHATRIKVGRGEDAVITEFDDEPAAPAPRATTCPAAPDALPSTGGQTRTTADHVATFEAAVSTAQVPAPANHGVVPEVAPKSPDPTDPVLVERVLAHLEATTYDTRVKTQCARLRAVLAELKANRGRAIHPKYRLDLPIVFTDDKPF